MNASIAPARRGRGRPRGGGAQGAEPVQALDKALHLLRLLADHDGLTLTEISQRGGVAPSTAYRALTTLSAHGFVAFDETSQAWSIGVEAFRIGGAFIRRRKIAEIGREAMAALMRQTGETVNLGLADEGDVVFISQVETHEPIRAFFRPGGRGPMHASGIGKALLAEMDEGAVRRHMEAHGLPRFTDKTIDSPSRLLEHLAEIRARGYAIDDEERHVGMRCVAAVIHNEYGEPIAGVSVSGPTARVTEMRLAAFGAAVVETAAAITHGAGGVQPGRQPFAQAS